MSDLESTLGLAEQPTEYEEAVSGVLARSGFQQAGLLTLWEVQSQLATMALLALVALAPFPLAVGLMLGWSLVATVVYWHARKRGLPDVFDAEWQPGLPGLQPAVLGRAAGLLLSIVKALLAGLQPFLYTRLVAGLLARPVTSSSAALARTCLLWLGLLMFGVTAAHHLLRRAGLSDDAVLRFACVGSVLNVSYRLALAGLVVNLLTQVVRPITG